MPDPKDLAGFLEAVSEKALMDRIESSSRRLIAAATSSNNITENIVNMMAINVAREVIIDQVKAAERMLGDGDPQKYRKLTEKRERIIKEVSDHISEGVRRSVENWKKTVS